MIGIINFKFGIKEIFILTKNLGGTISGEHGIGSILERIS